MLSLKKSCLILGIAVLCIVVVIAVGIVIFMFGGQPLEDGTQLAGGRVTVVVDWWGPIKIGAYLFELEQGGFGLVDATLDSQATAIHAALTRLDGTPEDIRAILFTHGHDDHIAGARSFPKADVYVLSPDVAEVEARGIAVTRGLNDGELLSLSGTTVEVFAVPGHTRGSAAYLIHGVLFLGDSAGAAYDGSISSNPIFFSEDAGQNERSLRVLAERLISRRGDVSHIAVGHQGAVEGLDPLIKWSSAP